MTCQHIAHKKVEFRIAPATALKAVRNFYAIVLKAAFPVRANNFAVSRRTAIFCNAGDFFHRHPSMASIEDGSYFRPMEVPHGVPVISMTVLRIDPVAGESLLYLLK